MTREFGRFTVTHQVSHGRVGRLMLPRDPEPVDVVTPTLFPVVCYMTGTTARGGGLWKYILQADLENGLLRRGIPTMSQVLHFLNFSSNNARVLKKWRQLSLRGRYNREVEPSLSYSAPIFLDSGGFQLLGRDHLDLSEYGLSLQDGNGPRTILELQRDLGGDIVASLDYPLVPGLDQNEALDRMRRSRDNAVEAALLLKEMQGSIRFLFAAVHGQDRESVKVYVRLIFDEFRKNGLSDFPLGLAVGSLVPLRGSKKYSTIMEIVQGVVGSIPADLRDRVPIHVFGITGNLVPLLAYLGVDSFDSSTYVQAARSLGYIDPRTLVPRSILEMEKEDWVCECAVCRRTSLAEIQDALTSSIRYKPLPSGYYKSKYYGDIALHNLQQDFDIVRDTRSAIEAGSLQEYLVQHVQRFPQLQPPIETIANTDASLRSRLTRTVHPVHSVAVDSPEPANETTVSLRYTSDDFNILDNGYTGPPFPTRVLLILPCSRGKPYSRSRTHRFISKKLEAALGDAAQFIHKVVLSGLYGPVPEEYENEEPVRHYEFQLQHYDHNQLELVADRISQFLEQFGPQYEACVGYATSRAYRDVLERAAERDERLIVLPEKPKSRRLSEFFRLKNAEELTRYLAAVLEVEPIPRAD